MMCKNKFFESIYSKISGNISKKKYSFKYILVIVTLSVINLLLWYVAVFIYISISVIHIISAISLKSSL